MDWEGGSYMYDGVNLSRHAKSKREVSKKGICQRDAGYARNIFDRSKTDELPSHRECDHKLKFIDEADKTKLSRSRIYFISS